MGHTGRVVACDIDDGRLQTVRELAARLGVTTIEPVKWSGERPEEVPAGPFDAVLVDVPCSNTGVLGKRPEVRWRLRPDDVRELATVQERLLRLAISRARPGGAVVYSTCSIEPEENAALVRRVLRAGGVKLEAEEEAVPGRPSDGGYWARLRLS
jgi:16S rRNA (cytosine967-C5)-methyltransferase